MENIDITKLKAKDKMLIAKAIADIAQDIYDSNKQFILNQIMKSGKYSSDFGQFSIEAISKKTIQETIDSNKEKIRKLQEENEQLEKIADKTARINNNVKLMSKHTTLSDQIAIMHLQDIIKDLNNARLTKAANAIAKIAGATTKTGK